LIDEGEISENFLILQMTMEADEMIGVSSVHPARSGGGSLNRERAAKIVEELNDNAVEGIGPRLATSEEKNLGTV
jgi:hypothetical protein